MEKQTARNTQGITSGRHDKRQLNRFRPNSQCSKVLKILQSGNSLTSLQAALMGIPALPAYIFRLRRSGYEIVCTMEKRINKYGEKVRYGRYTLEVSQT